MPTQNGTNSATPAQTTEEAIAKRAYELFLQRGSVPGFELDDWLQAEAELISIASVRKSKTTPASTNGKSSPRASANR